MHAGSDCNGDSIFYSLKSLRNRALLIQNILHPPFSIYSLEKGYLYLFPNISFAEEGSMLEWRFVARVLNFSSDLEYPSLQVWRTTEEGPRLFARTEFSSAPNLILGAVNVYSYDVNLTYQAGDFIGLYQPPLGQSKYALSFVNSSNFKEPVEAYEIPTMNSNFSLNDDDFLDYDMHLIEPIINIRSTSMPNDTHVFEIVRGAGAGISTTALGATTSNVRGGTTTASITGATTTVMGDTESDENRDEQSTIIYITVVIVVGMLFLIILVLISLLYVSKTRYKRSKMRNSPAVQPGKHASRHP